VPPKKPYKRILSIDKKSIMKLKLLLFIGRFKVWRKNYIKNPFHVEICDYYCGIMIKDRLKFLKDILSFHGYITLFFLLKLER